MRNRLVVAVMGLVGVVIIALGVASATLWRADDVLVADLQADEPIVMTDPGVLELAASEVTVRIEADGPVVLAVGRDTDVAGWVGTDAHQLVTGLSGWHELAAEEVATPTAAATAPGEGEAPAEGEVPAEGEAPVEGGAPVEGEAVTPAVPDPTGSDLWIVEATGDGEAELTWTAQPGRWSLLAVSTGQTPLRLSLAWPQVVTTPWLWPCVAFGSLLLLAAGALLIRDVRRGRRPSGTEWTPVLTGPLPVVGADGVPVQLTRRQLRELAAHGAVGGSGVRAPRDDAPTAPDAAPDPRVPVGADARGTASAGARENAPGGARENTPAGARENTPAGARGTAPAGAAATAPVAGVHGPTSSGADDAADATSAARRAQRAATSVWVPEGLGAARSSSAAGASGRDAVATRPPAPGAGATGRTSPGVPSTGTATPFGAPDPAHPHGRPTWLGRESADRPTTNGPAVRPPGAAQTSPGSPGRPGLRARPDAGGPERPGPGTGSSVRAGVSRPGWTSAPPAPGAVAGPSSGPDARRRPGPVPSPGGAPYGRGPSETPAPSGAAAPDGAAHPETPRPAWLRDAPVPDGPRAGAATLPGQPGGSRADAWRRAWGLTATDDDPTSKEE